MFYPRRRPTPRSPATITRGTTPGPAQPLQIAAPARNPSKDRQRSPPINLRRRAGCRPLSVGSICVNLQTRGAAPVRRNVTDPTPRTSGEGPSPLNDLSGPAGPGRAGRAPRDARDAPARATALSPGDEMVARGATTALERQTSEATTPRTARDSRADPENGAPAATSLAATPQPRNATRTAPVTGRAAGTRATRRSGGASARLWGVTPGGGRSGPAAGRCPARPASPAGTPPRRSRTPAAAGRAGDRAVAGPAPGGPPTA